MLGFIPSTVLGASPELKSCCAGCGRAQENRWALRAGLNSWCSRQLTGTDEARKEMTTHYWPVWEYPESHTHCREYCDINVTVSGGIVIFWSTVFSGAIRIHLAVFKESGRLSEVTDLSEKTCLGLLLQQRFAERFIKYLWTVWIVICFKCFRLL